VSGHLLSVVIFLPLAGVAALVLGGDQIGDRTARSLTLFVTVATFIVSLAVLARFEQGQPGFQLIEQASWVQSIGLQ
jgi:NADH-quinone oxidoreductase subunit M